MRYPYPLLLGSLAAVGHVSFTKRSRFYHGTVCGLVSAHIARDVVVNLATECFEGNVLGCEILGGLHNRKLEGQSGTGAERAVGFNYAAMEFDDALSNGQA